MATVEQTIDLTASGFTAQQIDTENLNVIFGGRVRSGTANPAAAGTIEVTFYDASGDVLEQYTAVATNTTDRWELVGASQSIPVHARTAVFEFIADGNGGTDDSYLDGAFFYIQSDNLRPDQGSEGNTDAGQSDERGPHLAIETPEPVRQLGPERPTANPLEFVRQRQLRARSASTSTRTGRTGRSSSPTITPSTPDTGEYTWTAADSGINFGTYGLRIQISLVGDPAVFDRSTETFTVPENTTTFYVNDGSTRPATSTPPRRAATETTDCCRVPRCPTSTTSSAPTRWGRATRSTWTLATTRICRRSCCRRSGRRRPRASRSSARPTPATAAVLSFANPLTVAPLIELDSAPSRRSST